MRRSLATKSTLVVFSIISSMALVMGGCNSPSQAPSAAKQKDQAPAWKLSLQSKCSNGAEADQCVGAYGFSVLANGFYEAGPGPSGQVQSGSLTSDELVSLRSALAPALGAAARHAQRQHDTVDADASAGVSDDTLTLVQGRSAPQVLLSTVGNDVDFQLATVEAATQLHSAIRELALKYYTLPFPDPCADEAAQVQAELSATQVCKKNADCTYVGPSYDVLRSDSTEYLLTDDCSVLKPLVAANLQLVSAAQTQLISAREALRNTCGDRFSRSDCSQVTGFALSGNSPVCERGVCQAQ